MRRKPNIPFILAVSIALAVFIFSCRSEKIDPVSNYSRPDYWLSLPDSAPKPVDVFYLYPTCWQKTSETDSSICEIDNPMMLKYSAYALLRQASAFETVANIYAPYYRQADAATLLPLPADEQEKVLGGIPKSDVFDAFEYYIKNLNNGRPFILAGHSQGSNILIYLLSEYMKKNPKVYARMVAAYVIGYSVTEEYLAANPHLKFAEGPDDTGVIISYNTEAPVVGEPGNPVVLPGAIAINPISWTRGGTLATKEESLGSILINPDGSVITDGSGNIIRFPDYADAQVNVERGVVVCSTVDVNIFATGNAVFGKGVFHSFDYPFYYYNLRQNASVRIEKYLSEH